MIRIVWVIEQNISHTGVRLSSYMHAKSLSNSSRRTHTRRSRELESFQNDLRLLKRPTAKHWRRHAAVYNNNNIQSCYYNYIILLL